MRGKSLAVAIVVVTASLVAIAHRPVTAPADVIRHHNDEYNTGWYPDQPGLAPGIVTGGTFGKLFTANVDGQVWATPIVHSDTLLVVTENDNVYGLDPRTGAQRWSKNVGTPWKAAEVNCPGLVPNIGITGTPTVDPATGVAYFVAKSYISGSSGPVKQQMHAVDMQTGADLPGFPVTIAGFADNAPTEPFLPRTQLQRPGLLLHQGVVYAGFGGHCDRKPYNGWIVGINATTGQITAMWAAQATGADGSGIWQSGGALLSDGPNRIFIGTGNGNLIPTGPTPGNQPPPDLSEAVVRLKVLPDGKLRAVDFFTPYDAELLDKRDADFGSGGPVALPESYQGTPLFGTTKHPHLMVEVGKQGSVYLMDRDNLGGYRAGPNGADKALGRFGPYGGVWSTPAIWPGNGGYIYITHGSGAGAVFTGYLRVYKYGLNANGDPTLAMVARTQDGFGFGSGAPIVTSSGLNTASALVWVIWNPDGSGVGAQLRAYDPLPVQGKPVLRWSAPIGTGVKFAPPSVSDNRVYVGTRDGTVHAFGSPVDQPLAASPTSLSYPDTVIGQTAQQRLTLHATRDLTVSSVTSNSPDFVVGTPSGDDEEAEADEDDGHEIALPIQLEEGDEITVPVSFAPQSRALLSGALNVDIDVGTDPAISMSGRGMLATGELDAFPDVLSMGGAPLGSSITQAVTFSNIGGAPLKVTRVQLPPATGAFKVVGMPAIGATIPKGGSIVAGVMFTPKTAGNYDTSVGLGTNAPAPGVSFINVALSATSAPRGKLQLNQPHGFFGPVRIGTAVKKTIVVKNVGQSAVTVTKSQPPVNVNGFNTTIDLFEGTTFAPGQQRAIQVEFKAMTPGHFRTTWTLNGDDTSGLQTIMWDAYAVTAQSSYWMVDTRGTVYPFGTAKALGGVNLPEHSIVGLWPSPSGQGYNLLDTRGRVFGFGDAPGFGNADERVFRPFEQARTMAITPTGKGYWIFTSYGRVLSFGDAPHLGDLTGTQLAAPIISSVATPSGRGYYMIASDGGVFAFGDARFRGSTAELRLNQPVIGLVPTATGLGYWLVASDGGVFSYGDAGFKGSMGKSRLNKPITGMVRYGDGYLMVATDGGVFNFSRSPFVGSLGSQELTAPVIGVGAYSA